MSDRISPRGLDTEGVADGDYALSVTGGHVTGLSLAGGSAGSSGLPVIDVVADHGAAVDGVTDDTGAWQAALDAAGAAGGGRIISSKAGVSIIGGALQDTGGANAQLVLPKKSVLGDEQISIVIEGPTPPPTGISVIGSTPTPDNHLVLKSTLTAGSGGNLLGGVGPSGSVSGFTFLDLRLANMTFRMPANPTHTALNLLKVVSVDLDHVIVDAGSYYIQGLAEPTTSTSYGIKLPDIDNGAHARLGAVDVVGFYNGYLFNEHSNGQQVNAWGCKRAFVFATAYHASKFQRLMAVHCQRGMVFTGTHYVDVDQFNIEHATSGWWVAANDIDDASNYGHGSVSWHVVKAGVGIDATFTKNGGSGLQVNRMGTAAGGSSLTVQDENGTIATGVTQIDFQGASVAATVGTGEVVVTVTGSAASSGELLMQDGVTAPPVPLENEARDDWLYQG